MRAGNTEYHPRNKVSKYNGLLPKSRFANGIVVLTIPDIITEKIQWLGLLVFPLIRVFLPLILYGGNGNVSVPPPVILKGTSKSDGTVVRSCDPLWIQALWVAEVMESCYSEHRETDTIREKSKKKRRRDRAHYGKNERRLETRGWAVHQRATPWTHKGEPEKNFRPLRHLIGFNTPKSIWATTRPRVTTISTPPILFLYIFRHPFYL